MKVVRTAYLTTLDTIDEYSGRFELINNFGDTIVAQYHCKVVYDLKTPYAILELTDNKGKSVTYPEVDLAPEEIEEETAIGDIHHKHPVTADDLIMNDGQEEDDVEYMDTAARYNCLLFALMGTLVFEMIHARITQTSPQTHDKNFITTDGTIMTLSSEFSMEDALYEELFSGEIKENEALSVIATETGIELSFFKRAKYSTYSAVDKSYDNEKCFQAQQQLMNEYNGEPPNELLFPILLRIIELS